MKIKDQRNRLLELLSLWAKSKMFAGAVVPPSFLVKDSQELIKKINEQISLEDV